MKKPKLLKLRKLPKKKFILFSIATLIALATLDFGYKYIVSIKNENRKFALQTQESSKKLEETSKELGDLKNQDQYKRNEDLQKQITAIETTYKKAVTTYEDLLKLKEKTKDTSELDAMFADSLSKLSQKEYETADATLNNLASKINDEETKLAASVTIPASVPQSNTPPGSGYSRQTVKVENLGSYLVSLVAADISDTEVVVDTASSGDCGNDCPVLPLSTYVSRNSAFAGVNGTYFCPASYPSCGGKTNSFDLLVMNKDKTYFNSDNNVYSSNPAVIFGDGYIRFVSSVSQWGRDTSPNGVISNFPLLVFNSQVVFGGDDDPKKGSKGSRSFVANKGNTVYIGVVSSATVAESARVLQTMGMENAMNLDDGGSTALWSGGYKVGPGRNLPNVVLFVSK